MTPRQRLVILLLGLAGALLGFGFIWFATFDERDESRCRFCDTRGSVERVTMEPASNERDTTWLKLKNDGGFTVGVWSDRREKIDCYCRACLSGWHSAHPPKRKSR